MTILHMRIACWMPKATDTHSEYLIFIALCNFIFDYSPKICRENSNFIKI